MKLVLIGSGRRQVHLAKPAGELYLDDLFELHRELADRRLGGLDYVLSAMHGVVSAEFVLEPYELSLSSLDVRARREWGALVASQLIELTSPGDELVVLATHDHYRDWRGILEAAGREVFVPFAGMGVARKMRAIEEALEVG